MRDRMVVAAVRVPRYRGTLARLDYTGTLLSPRHLAVHESGNPSPFVRSFPECGVEETSDECTVQQYSSGSRPQVLSRLRLSRLRLLTGTPS